jgi:hypothetical protein
MYAVSPRKEVYPEIYQLTQQWRADLSNCKFLRNRPQIK